MMNAGSQICNNTYLIKHIFNYLSNKTKYLMINHVIDDYIFNQVHVEFSFQKYINWFCKFPTHHQKQLTDQQKLPISDLLIPLRINFFKSLTVKLINDDMFSYYNYDSIISYRMIHYLLTENLLYKYFPTVSHLILKNSSSYSSIDLTSLNNLKYLNCYNTIICNLFTSKLQTLIIDVRNLPLNQSYIHLKYLKILSLDYASYNYEKLIKFLNAALISSSPPLFPSLEILYLDFFIPSPIILTPLTKLKIVFTHYPTKIITAKNVFLLEINTDTINQSSVFF